MSTFCEIRRKNGHNPTGVIFVFITMQSENIILNIFFMEEGIMSGGTKPWPCESLDCWPHNH